MEDFCTSFLTVSHYLFRNIDWSALETITLRYTARDQITHVSNNVSIKFFQIPA